MPAACAGQRWRDVVDLVLVQADRAHQVDLDLVAGGEAADQIASRLLHRLRDRQDRRDVVAGMRVVGGQERVVHVELAHRGAVRPGGPFGADALARRPRRTPWRRPCAARPSAMSRAETTGWRLIAAIATAALSMMRLTIIAATSFSHRDLVGGDAGDLPGELVLALQVVLGRVTLTSCRFMRFLHGAPDVMGLAAGQRAAF